MLLWIKMPLGTAPNFGPSIVAKRLDGSRCHWYGGRPRPRRRCVRWRPSSPVKGAQPPVYGPCLLWPRSPISATAMSSC